MALKNRTEVESAINALAAVVSLSDLQTLLDDNFADNVLYRKDVSLSTGSGTGSQAIDFDGYDYIEFDASGGDVEFTFSNILAGEVKYLKITHTLGEKIRYTNLTISDDVDQRYLDEFIAAPIVRITNKDGSYYGTYINVEEGEWQGVTTYQNSWTGNISYRIKRNGDFEMIGTIDDTSASGLTVFTLPTAYIPNLNIYDTIYLDSTNIGANPIPCVILASGGTFRVLYTAGASTGQYSINIVRRFFNPTESY